MWTGGAGWAGSLGARGWPLRACVPALGAAAVLAPLAATHITAASVPPAQGRLLQVSGPLGPSTLSCKDTSRGIRAHPNPV